MENIYIVMLVVLFALAITDLVVGVSNDAVNFLNSAIGSKAISLRTIMIVASLGVAVGAIFSSGLMEVARKGIFMPSEFYFDEIMIIFMAVMITDVLLLDFFNSLGLPTSTTVSIVFELLGAAVSIAVIKLYTQEQDLSLIVNYINTSKATEIVLGILLSVVVAFSIGAFVQYISRLIFTFQYEKKLKYVGAIFGGVSLTSITYFIFIKGMKSISFLPADFKLYVYDNTWVIISISLVVWSLISQLLMSVFKTNILKAIILIGTFALALAFAGNDLVNFIGVPIAAYQSFDLWQTAYQSTGVLPSEFPMNALAGSVETPEFLLIMAGGVMVLTLWLSSKARAVVDTGVNLSRQGDGAERFEPNTLSRVLVRYSVVMSNAITTILPSSVTNKIESKFEKPNSALADRRVDAPAFDTVRASVNLVVASILISIGTNLKLPLSTTYVTFMVAMGTSLADRAWDRESAVYRVAGVVNVVGGWFITAGVAFLAAAIFAAIIWYGGMIALAILVIVAAGLIVRSAILHSKKIKEEKNKKRFNRHDIITINEITIETSQNISSVIQGINKRYSKTVDHLGYHDLGKLRKDSKKLNDLEDEVDELKDNVFYFIKSLEDNSVEASKFYILFLDTLQDMVQSIGHITRSSYKHVNNNHKNLKFNQIRDLKSIDREMQVLFDEIIETFDNHSFSKIDQILNDKQTLLDKVSGLIQKQIERIRTSETSPKNTKLYFGLLLETKDLVTSTMSLLQLFKEYYEDAKREF
ncbi:Phosphate transporter family protein [Mesonia phycicola]|uniref:Phosphate transporter n=1 Tax=Mesonia phycicola TaxID=579105 RepID=A0A1M6EWD9_9FLAO|nr:inorganic phosphate transporter [Mesonia phycicola]SHI89775.1 Phosphate transporter family protein [Mesonia phycicola]